MQKGHMKIAAALVLGALCAQAVPNTSGGYQTAQGTPIQDYFDYSNMPDTESMARMRSSVNAAMETQRERMKQAPREIIDGLEYTVRALNAMKKGDRKVAESSLRAATKLFEIALTNNPGLKMVPIDDAIEIDDLMISPSEVSGAIDGAERALEEHRTQEARMLLMPLHEQMTVETHLLPMALYPDAAKLALIKLKKGDEAGALAALQDGFEAIVTEEAVLPLPLLKARAFADAASELGKARKKEAQAMIAHAQDELKNAVLLGYTSADDVDYKMVKDQMDRVEKAVGEGADTRKCFGELERAFDALFEKPANRLHKRS